MSTEACQDLWHIIPWFVKTQISCTDFLSIAPRQGKLWKKNKYNTLLSSLGRRIAFNQLLSGTVWFQALPVHPCGDEFAGKLHWKGRGKVPSSALEAVLFGALIPKFAIP